MFGTESSGDEPGLVARLHTDLDDLLARDLTRDSGAQVIDLWRELERFRNRLAVLDHAIIAQVQTRHLDTERGATSTTVFARAVLRVGIGEARARVRAAEAAGPRTALSGEPLAPVYEHVAAAQAEGVINPVHAALVVKTVEKLPSQVQEPAVEQFLVEHARQLDPDTLGMVAQRLAATLDPDGTLKDPEYRRKHRDLTLSRRPDGSGRLTGEVTAELAEHLHVLFDAFAKPAPEAGGQRDPRPAGQRRHDGLLTALQLLERAQQYPATAGVTATVILTVNQTDWHQRSGVVVTGHGAIVPTPEACQWVDGHARTLTITFDQATGERVEGITRHRRTFTEGQRLALVARDGGCCFPGCDRPPEQCESHHVIEYQNHGPTSTDNGVLLCGWHHREFANLGWKLHMRDGVPHWTPPAWLRANAA